MINSISIRPDQRGISDQSFYYIVTSMINRLYMCRKIVYTLIIILSGIKLNGAEITVNNVSLDPFPLTDCTNSLHVTFDLSYANLVDDNFYDGITDLRGFDIYDIVIRDGDCNLIFYTFDFVMPGTTTDVFTIPGLLNDPSLTVPVSAPFTVSFHDTDNPNTSQTSYLDTPPLAVFLLDPASAGGDCSSLPNVGTQDCPFAVAPIPTLSQWGLIILSMMLVIIGIAYQKQERFQFS